MSLISNSVVLNSVDLSYREKASLVKFMAYGHCSCRTLFLAAVLVVLTTISAVASPWDVSCTSYAFGKRYDFDITHQMVKGSPKWPEESESPPLGPRKALRAAEKVVSKFVKPDPTFKRTIAEIALIPIDEDEKTWYWSVRFEWHVKQGGETGLPHFFDVPVLMDGTALEPKVFDAPAGIGDDRAEEPENESQYRKSKQEKDKGGEAKRG